LRRRSDHDWNDGRDSQKMKRDRTLIQLLGFIDKFDVWKCTGENLCNINLKRHEWEMSNEIWGVRRCLFVVFCIVMVLRICIAILAIAVETCRYIHVMSGYRWVYWILLNIESDWEVDIIKYNNLALGMMLPWQ
jgi:hypothetical protein